jgi:hypothetical protein
MDAVRRSDPFTIKKDSALEVASVAAATSLAAHGAERGEGCAIIILNATKGYGFIQPQGQCWLGPFILRPARCLHDFRIVPAGF